MTVPGGAGSPDPVWTEPQGLNQTRGRWSLWGVGATNQPERAAQLAQWRAGGSWALLPLPPAVGGRGTSHQGKAGLRPCQKLSWALLQCSMRMCPGGLSGHWRGTPASPEPLASCFRPGPAAPSEGIQTGQPWSCPGVGTAPHFSLPLATVGTPRLSLCLGSEQGAGHNEVPSPTATVVTGWGSRISLCPAERETVGPATAGLVGFSLMARAFIEHPWSAQTVTAPLGFGPREEEMI